MSINQVSAINDERYFNGVPSEIVDILDNNFIVVACGDGQLVLESYDFIPALSDSEKLIYFTVGNLFGKAHY